MEWLGYDEQTGELISTGKNAGSHYLRSKEQDKSYKKKLEKERNKDPKKFVVSVNKKVEEVSKHMNLQEAGAMFSMMVHLDFNTDGIIMKNGKAITMKDLEGILGKGKAQVSRIIASLEKLSLIFRLKQGRSTVIKVNEEFHFIGKVVKKEFTTKVYTVKAKSLLDGLELQELGLLYKIIPHFHFEHMVLCSNPTEKSPDHLGQLSLTELADVVQVDRTTMQRLIPKLVRKNALMKAENGRMTHYMVNPNIFFRLVADTELTEIIRMLFDREEPSL